VATLAAFLFPAVIVLAVGAVQLEAVYSFRQKAVDVGDASVLWGVQQMAVSPLGATNRTTAWAQAQLATINNGTKIDISSAQIDSRTMKVTIDGVVPSFFGNMLPAGGFKVHVESTAQSLNGAPLCVLVFGTHAQGYQTKVQNLNIGASGAMTASACAVYSDQDINVGGGAALSANTVEAVGKANGPITPTPQTGAAHVPDPFAALNVDFPYACLKGGSQVQTVITIDTMLPPGVHCDNITVQNGAKLTLSPGEHYFGGDLTLQDTSILTGDDVVLVFDKTSKFDFNGTSSVTLAGRKTGPLAGFVIACDRANNANFMIESDHVSALVGTVYIPSAQLVVDGKNKVAQSSPWTVIVAQAVNVQGSSNLVINADYASSTVPVPSGVGPSARGSKLIE
jgi:hypothetical protein